MGDDDGDNEICRNNLSACIRGNRHEIIEIDPDVSPLLATMIDEISVNENSIDLRIDPIDSSLPHNNLTITKLDIKMPAALNRKARPKGSEKTNVIGLSKCKKKLGTVPQRFIEMNNLAKN